MRVPPPDAKRVRGRSSPKQPVRLRGTTVVQTPPSTLANGDRFALESSPSGRTLTTHDGSVRGPIARLVATTKTAITDGLEGPRAVVEAFIGADSGTPVHKRDWSQLSSGEQGHLKALGCTAAIWDRGLTRPTLPASTAFQKTWSELSSGEKGAARALGLEPSWNASLHGRASFLGHAALRDALADLLATTKVIGDHDVRDRLVPAANSGVSVDVARTALGHLLHAHGRLFSETGRRALRDGLTSLGEPGVHAFDGAGSGVTLHAYVRAGSLDQVRAAIIEARTSGVPLGPAGRRDSGGGQTLVRGGVSLDLSQLNRIGISNGHVLAESGTTLAQLQTALAKQGRTLAVAQTSNAFTLGGSLSTNAYGSTLGRPPLAASVRSFRLMNPDGDVSTVNKGDALFRLVLGGQGMFGIVLDAELDTIPDRRCRMDVGRHPEGELPQRFQELAQGGANELAWARLAPRGGDDALVFSARRDDSAGAMRRREVGPTKREVERVRALAEDYARVHPAFLEAVWWADQRAEGGEAEAPRSELLSPNLEALRGRMLDERVAFDVLHTYFVPKAAYAEFLAVLRSETADTPLSVLVREVKQDDVTALPFARTDSFAFAVATEQSVLRDPKLQLRLIDAALAAGGTFHLGNPRVYSRDQLQKAYPAIDAVFDAKRTFDPGELFSNALYEAFRG